MMIAFELARNSLLAVVLYLAPRFANVLIFILIGRMVGPRDAGIFSLATTYLLIFTAVLRGLDDLLVRQVSREPEQARRYLASFLLLRFGLSILLYGVLAVIVLVIFAYPVTTAVPILVLGLSVIPDSLSLAAQSALVGLQRFGLATAVLSGINIFKLVAGVIALSRGVTIVYIAGIWLLGSTLGMIILLILTIRQVGGIHRSDWIAGHGLHGNWHVPLSFIGITMLVTLEFQMDLILLSVMQSAAEVGWYSAATTITATIIMVSQAYRMALYPLMTRYAKVDPSRLAKLYEKSMYYLSVLIVPMSAGLIILATPIVLLIFGPKFGPTAAVLQVLAIALPFQFLTEPSNRMLLVHDQQRALVKFLCVSLSLNVGLNLLLIPAYSAMGAGIARVCSSAVFFVISYRYVKPFSKHKFNFTQIIARPTAAMSMMVIAILVMPNKNLFGSIAFGISVYFITFVLIRGIPTEDWSIFKQTMTKFLKRREDSIK